MDEEEAPLEMVQRHVRLGEAHIQRRQEIIDQLEASRSPLIENARALMVVLMSSMDSHLGHLAMIEEEQRAGRRDALGNLLPLQP